MGLFKRVLQILLPVFFSIKINAQNIDKALLKGINNHESKFEDKFLGFNSSIITPVTIAVPSSLVIAGIIGKNKKLRQDAIYVSGGYIMSGIVTSVLKKQFPRKRPFEKYNDIVQRPTACGGSSFPSGHTSAAFNLATSLSLRYRKWYVITSSYLYAASVAWARMYQGVHYPSDIFVGALVGSGTAWLGYRFQKKKNKMKGHNNIKTT